MLDIVSLSLADVSGLKELPLVILRMILSYLNTAQSVARLASTCKKLHSVVHTDGWRVFVRTHFGTLTLPWGVGDDEWVELVKRLTWQSRAWDRRGFSVTSLVPPAKKNSDARRGGRGGRGRRRSGRQTMPAQFVVDASSKVQGHVEEETVAWGAGEDIVVRWRESTRSLLQKEDWMLFEGTAAGFRSGEDDVTAISILDDAVTAPALLVGRASGSLQLLSTGWNDCGRSLAWFKPSSSEVETSIKQNEIQHIDTSVSQSTTAVATKDNIFFYPLLDTSNIPAWHRNTPDLVIGPIEALDIKNMQGSQEFGFLRATRFMGNGDLALCMTGTTKPLRYLRRTPTGSVIVNAAKQQPSGRCTETFVNNDTQRQNAWSLLPVSATSIPGGSGNAILSSYDDGTVRLQDLRSPSATDAIYQDHFELIAPMGPLISHGMERFVVGSARTAILKIFDFRWTKGYCYTDALPCGKRPMIPPPKSLTSVPRLEFTERKCCFHSSGHLCTLHALARTDFYRPSCNVYLPVIRQDASPVYSLAKPSDMSSALYAGLAGELVKMSLRDQEADQQESSLMERWGKRNRCGYAYEESLTSMVETGDGIALSDISKSKRVPAVHRQTRQIVPIDMHESRRLDDFLT